MKFKIILPLIFLMMGAGFGKQAQGRTIFFELSPVYFFFQGGGGAFGKERDHWQYGISFSTFNPNGFINEGSISISGAITTMRTINFEPFTKFFFSRERRRLYLGFNINPQLNFLRNDSTSEVSPILSVFAKPRIGWRWFPFKRHFYIDGSYSMQFLIFNGEPTTAIRPSDLEWKSYVGNPELSIGFRF